MCKTLASIFLAERMYDYLADQTVIGQEQSDFFRKERSTKDYLMLGKAITHDSRRKKYKTNYVLGRLPVIII